VVFFHGFTKGKDPSKRKNHAQDGGTLIATKSQTQRPAILPWSLCFEWRPSFRWYGHLARYAQLPDCCWTLLRMIIFENLNNGFADHAKNARNERARTEQINDECYAFRAAPCNAPRPSS
jgi:hypothetical protein